MPNKPIHFLIRSREFIVTESVPILQVGMRVKNLKLARKFPHRFV